MTPEELQKLLKELEALILTSDNQISALLSRFDSNLEAVLVKSADILAGKAAELEIKGGSIVASASNQAVAATSADMVAAALSEAGYYALVSDFVAGNEKLIPAARAIYKLVKPGFAFGVDALDILHTLQQFDVNYFSSFPKAAGSSMSLAFYDNVIVGSPFKQLVNNFREALTGESSQLRRYAKVYAQDSVMRFQATLDKQALGETGYWYYAGTLMKTSRQFCIARCGRFYTEAEVKAWNSMSWRGKAPGDVKVTRGGYNCRHRLLAVDKSYYDAQMGK